MPIARADVIVTAMLAASRRSTFLPSNFDPAWRMVLLIAAAVLLAYGDSITLPFHFDDIPHYLWLNDQSIGSIWLSAAGRPYYRPMQFFGWKLYETAFGRDSVVVYHLMSILVHALDAVLVALVARRLVDAKRGEGWWRATAAGLTFALFPFSYQVVPLPGSFTHPMVVLFVLLSILAYDRFRTRGRCVWRWLIVALVCGVFAFASNEGSLVLAAAIALYEAFGGAPRPIRWRWAGLFVLLAVVYFAWYQSRPLQAGDEVRVRGLEAIVQNAMYVLQGGTFPPQPIGRALMDAGFTDHSAVLSIGFLALSTLAVLYARAGEMRGLVFGAGWFAIFMVVPALLLPHDYLINAPRVLYLSACGAAWLWAGAAGVVRRQGRRLAALAFVAAVLAPSFIFIRQRMALYYLNAAPLQEVIDTALRAGPADRLLFVNLPAWVSAERQWYPIGHEGVLFLPAYTTLSDFVFVNTGQPSQAIGVEFNNLTTPQAYYYGVYGPPLDYERLEFEVRSALEVHLAAYKPEVIDLNAAGRVLDQTRPAGADRASFDSLVALESATWLACADRLGVTLDWRADAFPPGDAHIFVHVLDARGALIAQHDSPPLQGLLPFWQWQPGDRTRDMHPIDLPAPLEDGPYAIAVGLYNVVTGQRVRAALADGSRPPNDAVPIGEFAPGQQAVCP